ncbi:hypothetical protein [Prevotella nigrescens]|uniref:hypothetical protein n=1 Tax=Prevotella nigrescens TaxID=28133 RepID=UPI0015C5F741|nr:hypothetical protein [Prevotella nigrescens]
MTRVYRLSPEDLMLTASPGISNEEFDPAHDEVGAKEGEFDDDFDPMSDSYNPRWND